MNKVIRTVVNPDYYVEQDHCIWDEMNGREHTEPKIENYTTTEEYLLVGVIDGMNHPMLVVCDLDGTNIKTISSKNCKIAV